MSYKTIEALYSSCSIADRLPLSRPLMVHSVSAGFPSPAEGSLDKMLDLNELLVRHPTATFFVRVKGDSMQEAGILDGDLLVVEKGESPRSNDIVVAIVEGEFTIKRWVRTETDLRLCAANPMYPDILLEHCSDWEIWGVVRYAIHACRSRGVGAFP